MRPQAGRLERKAISLGAANALDYGLQFLLPIVLARALSVEDFGQYRLMWLAVMTCLVLAPLSMPQSLYYFLPRSDAAGKRLYLNHTVLFMCTTALLGAWALSALNPWQPASLAELNRHGLIVPAFAFLWTVAYLLDVLPTVEERVEWQAKVVVGLSALRAVALSVAAIATGELEPVLWTLVVFVLVKLALLGAYIRRHHGFGRPLLERGAFKAQVKYAAPFGFSASLYALRSQADQWVAAALFSLHQFAAFSVAAVIGPIVYICRQSVNNVFLPSMSRLESSGDVAGMLALNSRANVMVAALVFPVLAFAFVYAEEVITLIYTASYVEAAPVMQLYVLALALLVIELNSVMLILREGPFAMKANACLLVGSVVVSWYCAQAFGLVGAAAGSSLAVYADRLLLVRRISSRTGIPVSRMQDWGSLAVLAALAIAAALAAWGLLHGELESFPLVVRLGAAGSLTGLVYVGLLALLNGDGRYVTLRSHSQETP
jgi:O-antigen/teichoic acid export membrane protein